MHCALGSVKLLRIRLNIKRAHDTVQLFNFLFESLMVAYNIIVTTKGRQRRARDVWDGFGPGCISQDIGYFVFFGAQEVRGLIAVDMYVPGLFNFTSARICSILAFHPVAYV